MKKRFIGCITLFAIIISVCGCHSHTFTVATCTQPMTCIECGETQGETLPHSFAEATCAVPKTCTICGTTEGEANSDHSTLLGKCEVCGEYQNQDVLVSIVGYFDKAADYNSQAVSEVNKINSGTQDSWREYYLYNGIQALKHSRNEVYCAELSLLKTATEEKIKDMEIYQKIKHLAHIELVVPRRDDGDNNFVECIDSMQAYQEEFNEVVLYLSIIAQ